MGDFSNRILNKNLKGAVPEKDMVKLRLMAQILPPMAVKTANGIRAVRVGNKLVPANNNQVDHLQNLIELYKAVGMKGCEEYYNTIVSRKNEVVKVEEKEKFKALPWQEKLWRWIIKLLKKKANAS